VIARVSGASLGVAIALMLAALVARALMFADDRSLRRTAELYVGPLCIWCLVAVAVHGVAMAAAGTVSVGGIVLVFVIVAVAVALDHGDQPQEVVEAEPEPAPPPAPAPSGGSLWSR
jgi:hypothetical protein